MKNPGKDPYQGTLPGFLVTALRVLADDLGQLLQIAGIAEMDPQSLPPGFDQGLIITQCLGLDQGSKGQALGGDFKIRGRVGGDHKEQPVIRPTFMELARRMLETQAETGGDGIAGFCPDRNPHLLQDLDRILAPRKISVDGDIATWLGLCEEGV